MLDAATGTLAQVTLDVSEQGPQALAQARLDCVQDLRARGCGLTSLAPLKNARDLVELDVSENELEEALDFEVPHCRLGSSEALENELAWSTGAFWTGSNLECANLSQNRITVLASLGHHVNLRSLDASCNLIRHVGNLTALVHLEKLDLSNNALESIRPLGALPELRELRVANNRLTDLKACVGFPRLRFLACGGNRISTLEGLSACALLSSADLSGNQLANFSQLERLCELALLADLAVAGNPIFSGAADNGEFRRRVLFRLPQLSVLDGERVTAKEKVSAANFFGADRAHRQEVFHKHFGNQEPFESAAEPFTDPEVEALALAPLFAERVSQEAIEGGSEAVKSTTPYFARVFAATAIHTVLPQNEP